MTIRYHTPKPLSNFFGPLEDKAVRMSTASSGTCLRLHEVPATERLNLKNLPFRVPLNR